MWSRSFESHAVAPKIETDYECFAIVWEGERVSSIFSAEQKRAMVSMIREHVFADKPNLYN